MRHKALRRKILFSYPYSLLQYSSCALINYLLPSSLEQLSDELIFQDFCAAMAVCLKGDRVQMTTFLFLLFAERPGAPDEAETEISKKASSSPKSASNSNGSSSSIGSSPTFGVKVAPIESITTPDNEDEENVSTAEAAADLHSEHEADAERQRSRSVSDPSSYLSGSNLAKNATITTATTTTSSTGGSVADGDVGGDIGDGGGDDEGDGEEDEVAQGSGAATGYGTSFLTLFKHKKITANKYIAKMYLTEEGLYKLLLFCIVFSEFSAKFTLDDVDVANEVSICCAHVLLFVLVNTITFPLLSASLFSI
jgi:hypothetical protein